MSGARAAAHWRWWWWLVSGSLVSDSVIPGTVAHQAPLSMGLSRQEYWSGLPFSSPRDLPDPGIERASPALTGGFFPVEAPGMALHRFWSIAVRVNDI